VKKYAHNVPGKIPQSWRDDDDDKKVSAVVMHTESCMICEEILCREHACLAIINVHGTRWVSRSP